MPNNSSSLEIIIRLYFQRTYASASGVDRLVAMVTVRNTEFVEELQLVTRLRKLSNKNL